MDMWVRLAMLMGTTAILKLLSTEGLWTRPNILEPIIRAGKRVKVFQAPYEKGAFCVSRNISHFNNWAKEKNSAKTNSKTYIQIFAGKDFKGEVRPEPDEMEQRLFPKCRRGKKVFLTVQTAVPGVPVCP